MLKGSRYFRISVTGRCNMSCFYCHREGRSGTLKPEDELSPEDIEFACRVALDAGFRKFKLTGGEPTLRKDITEIVSLLSRLNLPDLSMITNASLLPSLAKPLWDAGLRRLNISLNSLDPSRFTRTQSHSTDVSPAKILEGLDAAEKAGFRGIKINFVFSDEESRKDLHDVIEYCKDKPNIIVLLPVISGKNYYSLDDLYSLVKSYGISGEEIITDNEGIRKRLVHLECGAKILLRAEELSGLRPFTFCGECTVKDECREGIFPVRMTYDGLLAPCMASNEHRIYAGDIIRRRDYGSMLHSFRTINDYVRKE